MVFTEIKVCSVVHTGVDALKTSFINDWAKIPKEMHASVGNFKQRIKCLIKRNGHHIENK